MNKNIMNKNIINTEIIESKKIINGHKKTLSLRLFKELSDCQTPSCSIIIIDQFYDNPVEIRDFALSCDFNVNGNGNFIAGNSLFPGIRTYKCYVNEKIRNKIQSYIEPFDGKISRFSYDDGNSEGNGCFQYVRSFERTLCHFDQMNWAGVLYLTPDSPTESGTMFCQHSEGIRSETDMIIRTTKLGRKYYDNSVWKQVDDIGNVFNRLILFNSKNFHVARNMFGNILDDARLFQLFFFSTDKGESEKRYADFLNKNEYL